MMFSYFFQLSLQGIYRKRKSSILTFLVLLVSFACIIMVLSVMGSISSTNAEFRRNTFGEWAFAVLPANGEKTRVEGLEQVDETGQASCCGLLRTMGGTIGLGTVDDTFLQIGRIGLEDGHFPVEDNEIAMEADTLSALGYDYTLGQEITLMVEAPPAWDSPFVTGEEGGAIVMRRFTLCGVIREYHSLWCINGINDSQALVSAFITPAAARSISEDTASTPILQLFFNVTEENKPAVRGVFSEQLYPRPDFIAFENKRAYPSGTETISPDSFYTGMIGAVALIAVFSVFFLQMRASYHSCSVCRSVGMTKGQLALLLTLETLILVIPAVVLGTLLGGALIFLTLRLLLFTGSVPIQVDIPAKSLAVIIVLWIVCTVLCRLVLFFIISRTQLTGAFQLSHGKSVKVRRFTQAAIFFLTALFGTSLVFTWMGCLTPWRTMRFWYYRADYEFLPPSSFQSRNWPLIPRSTADLIKDIPGATAVEGMGFSPVAVSFPGMDEIFAWLFVFDADGWDVTLDFGDDREAFLNGELVLLTFQERRASEFLLPEGEVTLHFLDEPPRLIRNSRLDVEQYGYGNLTQRSQPDDSCIMEKTTPVSIRTLPSFYFSRGIGLINGPYSVICSHQFLEDVLSQLEPGQTWDVYTGGQEYSYYTVYADADINSDYLSTDNAVAQFCKEHGYWLFNWRVENLAYQQEGLQEVILVASSGGCIAAISLLLLCNLLQLEAAQEQRKFAILRMIGMSKKQVRSRVLAQSLGQCLSAAAVGGLAYVGYTALYIFVNGMDAAELLAQYDFSWNLVTLPQIILVLCVCVIAPFLCFLLAKMGVVKEGGGSE